MMTQSEPYQAIRPSAVRPQEASWGRLSIIHVQGLLAFSLAAYLGPLARHLAGSFGVPPDRIGVAMALQVLPMFLGAIPVGWSIDRIGAARMLRLAAVAVALTNLSCYFAAGLVALEAALLVQGLALITIMIAGPVLLTNATVSGKTRDQALSLWATVPFLGAACGIAVAGQFAASPHWRNVFLLMACAAAMLVPISARLPRITTGNIPQLKREATTVRVGGLWRERGAILLGVALGMAAFIGQGGNAVMPFFLNEYRGISMTAATDALAGANLAGVLGGIAIGVALTRRVPVIWIAGLAAALGVVSAVGLFLIDHNIAAVAISLAGWSIAAGASVALTLTMLPRVVAQPARLGAATGLMNQFGALGSLVAAPTLFWLVRHTGSRTLILTAATAWVLFAVLIVLATHRSVIRHAFGSSAAGWSVR